MIKDIRALLLVGTIVGFCNWANGAAIVTLYDGINPLINAVDNGPGDLNPTTTGSVLFVTNVGVWNLVIGSALSKPVEGSQTDPVMDLTVQANSTAAGSLRVVFSDNGFGPASGLLDATVTGHLTAGAPATLSYDVYGDPANVVGATTVHITGTGTLGFPIGPTSAFGSLSLGAPYSLTQVVQVVATGPTSLTFDASFSLVPEPGSMSLAAVGIVAGIRRRYHRKGMQTRL